MSLVFKAEQFELPLSRARIAPNRLVIIRKP